MIMIINNERQLASIRKIADLQPIPGADAIECATIDGWEVVVKKGEFAIGDDCVYFEIDSMLPMDNPAFTFLESRARMYEGKMRARVKTIKLRGQLSQGIALPVNAFTIGELLDQSLDQILGIAKYEPAQDGSGCNPAGAFPIFIPKTDEERCQNIFSKYSARYKDVVFQKSLKLDGSSITMAWVTDPDLFLELGTEDEPYAHDYDDAQFIVASRNQVLRYNPESKWWMGVENYQIIEQLKKMGKSVAIQGELMGPGIQKNRENFDKYRIFAFRAWFIEEQRFATDEEFHDLCRALGMEMVPQLGRCKPFEQFETVKEMLADADIPSINHKIAEGVVYKSVDLVNGQMIHFKAINNKFLLKCED
jgi:RNA ligase (TIGR02306 family)